MTLSTRLDLSTPAPVDTSEISGHALRLSNRNNEMLERVFQESQTDLPKLIATIRWSILGLCRKPMAAESGISNATLQRMERDLPEDAKIQRELYTKLLWYFEHKKVSPEIREQMLELLAPGQTVLGLYERIGYEVGCRNMLDAVGISAGALWQRKKDGMVPSLLEVRQAVKSAYPGCSRAKQEKRAQRSKEGELFWTYDRLNQYESRTLEAPLSQLLVALERYHADHHESVTVASLMKHWECSDKTATALMHAELPPWEEVAHIVGTLNACSQHDWEAAASAEAERETFEKSFLLAREESGLGNADLSRYLNICAPEERIEGYEAMRTEAYRPSAEIRRVIGGGGHFGQVQARALVELVAADADHARTLADQFREERRRYYTRTGNALRGLPLEIRIDREYNGIKQDDLAALVLKEGGGRILADISKIETATCAAAYASPTDLRRLRAWTSALGREKAREPLERKRREDSGEMPDDILQAQTLADLTQRMAAWLGGRKHLTAAVQSVASERMEQVSQTRVGDIIAASVVPPLPVFRTMVESVAGPGTALPLNIERDWYAAYPEYLQAKNNPVEDPLSRVLDTIVHARELSVRAFAKNRMEGVADPDVAWALVHYPNSKYGQATWAKVEAVLLAADMAPKDVSWKLAQLLLENRGDVEAVMERLLPLIVKRGLELHPSVLPGLTYEELGIEKPGDAKVQS